MGIEKSWNIGFISSQIWQCLVWPYRPTIMTKRQSNVN